MCPVKVSRGAALAGSVIIIEIQPSADRQSTMQRHRKEVVIMSAELAMNFLRGSLPVLKPAHRLIDLIAISREQLDEWPAL